MLKFIGKISRKEVNELYGRGRAGIVIYQPAANHMEAQPIKMFEFMAAGLPVVASNFPLWKTIIEGAECGICVDPTDYKAVRDACMQLISNPAIAEKMGKNGHNAVVCNYSWAKEEKKLLELYKGIAEGREEICG